MKYAFLLLCITIAFTGNSQQWYTTYAPHGRDVEASCIVSPGAIFTAGGFEVAEQFEDIFRSSDYGVGWNVNGTDTPTSMVRSIVFTDSLNGYGVCYLGKFVKTTDGGDNWVKVDTFANKNFFEIIHVAPSNLFIVGGSRLNDSATILKSTDSGQTWNAVYNQPGHWLRTITFINAQTGFAVGEGSTILSTTDGGNNWQPVNSPVADRVFTGVVFTTSTTGYIIGGIRDSIRTMLKTIDAGQSWNIVHDERGGAYNDIDFIDASNGYIVGDSATVLKTTDGGQSWLQQAISGADADQQICTVDFYDNNLGVIGGRWGFVRIFTTAAPTQGITLGSTPIDTTNVSLIGKVNTHGIPVQSYFFVSADSTFPFQGTLIYGSEFKSDSMAYFTSQVGQLQPHTRYFFYLRVLSITGEVRGDTLSFVTNMPTYTLIAAPATNVLLTSATLSGTIKGLPTPATITFEYGTNLSMAYQVAATPLTITDTLLHTVTANITQLTPGTGFNYRIKAITPMGPYYSQNGYFNTPPLPDNYATLPATNITTQSATLNGIVFQQPIPVALSFEYGTTTALGNTIAATPDSVIDNGQYFPMAAITGLQSNTVYYYSLKVVANNGTTRYGDTMVFYTGNPQIPNWRFENWEHKTQYYPHGWYYYGNIGPTSSYNSSTAVNIYTGPDSTGSIAFNGIPFPGMDPLIGSPFTARPDSVIFYANYNIQTADTGFMLLVMKKNFAQIGESRYPFIGSTGGAYVRCAAPVTYTSGANPDSVLMAFATSIYLFDTPKPNQSWIKIDNISFTNTSQTIINANFEDFDTLDVDIPAGWQIAADAPPNLTPISPVTRTTDAYEGQYAARLETVNAPAVNMSVTAALATQQTGGGVTRPGFPVYYRCQTFNGYFKYQPAGNDTMSISIQMFRNGNVIGNSYLQVDTFMANYAQFSLPIYYFNTDVPDSGAIYIRNSSYNAHIGSVLYIDALGFDGFTDVQQVAFAPAAFGNQLKLYPNPANTILNVQLQQYTANATLQIADLTGTVMYSGKMSGDKFTLDIATLPAGIFIVTIADGEKVMQGKMIVVR
jgi:photosystem II stability/assembly factor-like uncharacterized protein